MNIWSEVMIALRGGMNDLGEAIETKQVIVILDERIRQINKQVQQQKEDLAKNLVEKKQAEQQINILKPEIEKYEGYALKALEKHDETLAFEVAEQVALLETELTKQQQLESKTCEQCDELRQYIRKSEQDLLQLTHQRDTVKASTNVKHAQESIANISEQKDGLSKPQTARDVLERIKKRQSELSKKSESNSLQNKLKKAGIIDSDEDVSADSILNRMKNSSS